MFKNYFNKIGLNGAKYLGLIFFNKLIYFYKIFFKI